MSFEHNALALAAVNAQLAPQLLCSVGHVGHTDCKHAYRGQCLEGNNWSHFVAACIFSCESRKHRLTALLHHLSPTLQ
eukprot:2158551-Amphidinium_carterae.1